MKISLVSAVLTSLASSSASSASGAAASAGEGLSTFSKDRYVSSLIEWIVSNDGYLNLKQEYRHVDPDDMDSPMGVFATETIEEGEELFSVPWDCIITDPEDHPEKAGMSCGTIRKVMDELDKFYKKKDGDHGGDDDSEYGPYLAYLANSGTMSPWPSAWSPAGKELLHEVLDGDALPPVEAMLWYHDWHGECNGSDTNIKERAAVMIFSEMGEENRLVPLYDMYRHRNGHWYNTETFVDDEDGQGLRASRTIQAGEEIHISHNMCSHCGPYRQMHYGTPDILRDYGFVEDIPQRWIFEEQGIGFDLVESDEGEGSSPNVAWLGHYRVTKSGIASLKAQYKRLTEQVQPQLEKVQNDLMTQQDARGNSDNLPMVHEFEAIWDYYHAMTEAMKMILPASDEVHCPGGFERDGECVLVDTYDDLRPMRLRYSPLYQSTCDNEHVFDLEDYDHVDTARSSFYEMNWHTSSDDVCLELDDRMQICSSYRPHYHEIMAHLPARYMNEVKRAAFVGGGDSMLLHELLKYPSMEKVLGLELDQAVVRSSFQHFHTQPHFDNSKVEWWFGDATETVLMLPKEYFGTFDLVFVDLSETAAPVTDEMNIMEALSMLLKENGVFVKNEIYYEQLSEMFDHTMQVYFQDVPKVCDQAFSIGSNGIDFMNPDMDNLKGHAAAVDTLLLQPVKSDEDRFAYIHNYNKNDATEQGKCREDETSAADDFDLLSGVLMVLEAENTTTKTLKWESIGQSLLAAIEKAGFTTVSSVSREHSFGAETGVVTMREGFVSARMWPDKSYCAFDIHLWGNFGKMPSLRDALAAVVGSDEKSLSSYRVLVTGMHGASSWEHDKDTIGPVITNTRNCEGDVIKSSGSSSSSTDEEIARIAIEESIKLIQSENAVAVVICGDHHDGQHHHCDSQAVVSKSKKISKVSVLQSCPDIKDALFSEKATELMFQCETEILQQLKDIVAKHGKIGALVIDPTTHFEMLKVMSSIVGTDRGNAFRDDITFIAFMPEKTESWRRNFLDRCLMSLGTRYLYRAEVALVRNNSNKEFELGIVSGEDPHFIAHVKDAADAIAARAAVRAEVRKISGGRFKPQEKWNPKQFTVNDYDQAAAIEQYNKQLPLGHQVILRLEHDDPISEPETLAKEVKTALQTSLTDAKFTDTQFRTFHDDVGDGAVIIALAAEGTAVAVLDGKNRFDVNLFAFDADDADRFVEEFSQHLPAADITSRDDQPRGTGRVVNTMQDVDNVISEE